MLLLLLACAGASDPQPTDPVTDADADTDTDADADSDTDTDADTNADPVAVDPLDLAELASEAEIEATIRDLSAIPTRYTATDGDEAARDYLLDRLDALGLDVTTSTFDAGDGTIATNIIGRQHGTADADVVYVFQAHYDSTSNQPDTLAPGADDNASGVAAVLEAARALETYPLAYSAWFVFTAAEEQGSLGSAALVEQVDREGVDVRGVLAPDMMAYWPLRDEDGFDILGDDDSEDLVNQMADIADQLGVAHKVWVMHDYCYGDDHTNWQEAGYPAISPMDCVEAHNLGRSSGETTPNYHRTTDTIDTLYLPFTREVVRVTNATFATWVVPLPPPQ